MAYGNIALDYVFKMFKTEPLLCFYSMNIHYLQWILELSTNSKLIYGPRAFPNILITGISEPFCHWIDTWDANSQEGGCNLAHSFKVLFHGWLMLCFLRCGETEHFGTRLWKNKTVYFVLFHGGKELGTEGKQDEAFKINFQVPNFLKPSSQFYHLETICVDYESTDVIWVFMVQSPI